jgi:phospho-N-acetylmuramoyl-pentapeptide-transferase
VTIADTTLVTYPAWYFMLIYRFIGVPFGLGVLAGVTLIATIPAFVVTALLGKPLIDRLRAAAARQTAYEDAPQSHQAKTGTPTMGGILFGVAPLVAVLLVPSRITLALAVLVYACMLIGAWDDLMSIRKQKNRGLRALPKFALTAIAALLFFLVAGPLPTVFAGIGVVPPWLWYGLSLCVILATTHAANLTDGLDGLAAGTVIPPFVVFTCAAGIVGAPLGVPMFSAAMTGAVLGFLLYNRHPARVFMGDTGSLAVGGALAGVAILTGTQLYLPLVGGVLAAETLSVIIQVASYKTTRRRVFRMSPLHHHFELGGMKETAVTARFWLASLVLSLLGFALITRTA